MRILAKKWFAAPEKLIILLPQKGATRGEPHPVNCYAPAFKVLLIGGSSRYRIDADFLQI